MLTRNLRFLRRLVTRNAYYYGLTWLGLVTAIGTALLIYSYSTFENSFDKEHEHAGHLYRVHFTIHKDGRLESVNANSTPVVGPLLYEQLESVEDFARLYPRSGSTVQITNQSNDRLIYPEDKIYHADSSFFRMFDFPLLIGDPQQVLKGPFKALTSRRFAEKAFGSIEQALGKTFQLSEEETYTIEGVFEDLPSNTHLDFEVVLSFSTLEILDWTRDGIKTDWGWYSHYNFLRLKEGHDADAINEEILAVTKPHTRSIDERINGGLTYALFPVKDIYLESNIRGEMDRKGNGFLVRFMGIIALIVLTLALINYLGITASISLNRIKETGLRKILGGEKRSLLMSFFFESGMHLIFSFILAYALLLTFWDHLPAFTGKVMPISILLSPRLFALVVLAIVLMSVACGAYHYFIVSRVDLVTSLKGADAPGRTSYFFRKGILFIQYLAGVSLVIMTLVGSQQIGLLRKTNPGFSHEDKLAIKLRRTRGDNEYFRKIDAFSKALSVISGIEKTALSSHIPSEEIGWTSGGKINGQQTTIKFHHYAVDEQFLGLYGLEIVAGSNYTENIPINQRSIIINERGLRSLGFEEAPEAIGKTFLYGGRAENPYRIIGVVRDHFQRGLKHEVDPIAFHFLPGHAIYTGSAYATIKVGSAASVAPITEAIASLWRDHFGGLEIEYSDVSQRYLEQYKTDRKAFELLTFFTAVAIMIALCGLIGIVAFTVRQRTKEVGIRKVLGASLQQILFLLSKSYLLIMIAASVLAWCLCYLALEQWLAGYPQRVSISFGAFLVASIAVLFLSGVVIVFQSLKSGVRNPIETLRAD